MWGRTACLLSAWSAPRSQSVSMSRVNNLTILMIILVVLPYLCNQERVLELCASLPISARQTDCYSIRQVRNNVVKKQPFK